MIITDESENRLWSALSIKNLYFSCFHEADKKVRILEFLFSLDFIGNDLKEWSYQKVRKFDILMRISQLLMISWEKELIDQWWLDYWLFTNNQIDIQSQKGLVSKNFNVPLKIKTKISHKSQSDLQYNRIFYVLQKKPWKNLNDSLNSGI